MTESKASKGKHDIPNYCTICGERPGTGISALVSHLSDEHPDVDWTYMYISGAFPMWAGMEDLAAGNVDDMVDKPPHYTSGSLECIDWIEMFLDESELDGYLKGNVLKYLWRYKDKGEPVRDLRKAMWYLDKLTEKEADPE